MLCPQKHIQCQATQWVEIYRLTVCGQKFKSYLTLFGVKVVCNLITLILRPDGNLIVFVVAICFSDISVGSCF